MYARRVNGATVRALRDALGHRLGDFAGLVNASVPHLSNIEAGRKQPSPHLTRKIAEQLGVPIAAITYVVADSATDETTHGDLQVEAGEDPPHAEDTGDHGELEAPAA
jgi:transcriptional regulator with XRE-family HTH domain